MNIQSDEELAGIRTMYKRAEEIMMYNRRREEKYYLFLDFDGVINVFYMPGTPEYEEVMKKDTFDFADHKCVARLQKLCEDYPVYVIISSSWRFAGMESCVSYLRKAGLSSSVPVIDRTQTEYFQSRESDILEYLMAHPDFSGYLVFDDGSMPDLTGHMVQTDPLKGWDEGRDAFARSLLRLQKDLRDSAVNGRTE